MAKGNKGFKERLNRALDLVIDDLTLSLPRVRRLYTPVWRKKHYEWLTAMDSDGLLVKERKVHEGDVVNGSIRIGVVIQSEFHTSLTRPNPFGKALVDKLPMGWRLV